LVEHQFKLDPFEKALFVFCNKQMNNLKILHFNEGFWLYYHRLKVIDLNGLLLKKKL
ncbi:IS66 family insertion sequence element accessory protein TnpB, partial [uncultured Clostridium sp.]